MSVFGARSIRLRLWWTALLVLIALGGAGLAVAADRPQNPLTRPELTWRADRNAQAWIEALADELALVDQAIVDLSGRGRQVLSQLQALDIEKMRAARTEGVEINAAMEIAIERLSSTRSVALAGVDEWRLGPQARSLLEQLSSASLSAEQVPTFWRGLAADAERVAGLVDALMVHDELVFRATTAGRQSRWGEALALMGQAAGPLGDATNVRDELAGSANVETLDDLLGRYRAYDAALVALYTYVRATGLQEGEEFDALQQSLERALAALPTDTSSMSVIVSELAGPSLTAWLVAIEAAHGDILDALAAFAAPDSDAP